MHLIIIIDKNCGGIVPVRIRNRVVEVRVKRTYMIPVVRVATHKSESHHKPLYIFIIIIFCMIIRGHAKAFPLLLRYAHNSPFHASGLQERAAAALQYAVETALQRPEQNAPTGYP